MKTTFLKNNRHVESRIPKCEATGLPRFRDRHQARDSIRSLARSARHLEHRPYSCLECKGIHIDSIPAPFPVTHDVTVAAPAFVESLDNRKRRIFVIDIENITHGATASRSEVRELWDVITQQAPGIAAHDHVVIGASRGVVHKYRWAVTGTNVKWVLGDSGPDGADKALLSSVDLRWAARNFDELVIMSGDHAFVGLAQKAKAAGLGTHVVTVEHPKKWSTRSRKLSASCDLHSVIRLAPRARSAEQDTLAA